MKRQGWFILLFCGFILTAWSVTTRKTQTFYNPTPVKLISPTGDYEKLWKRVDSLENKGLYKSASELVQSMFEKAIAENNSVQVVKSIMHRLKYNNYIQEEDYKLNITSLEKYSAMSRFPVKQILHSITADMYHGFYSQNRWRFYDRSTTVEFKPDDILTWDATTIANKIRDEHLNALTESEKSKTADIESFKDILQSYTGDAKFRPTLYDFLAHRAFDFFAHNEFDVTKPAVRFSVDDPAYIANRNQFLQKEISSSDSLSTRYHAARIIKDLVAFHANDKDPHALIIVDLERLNFVRSNASFDHADSLYYQTLQAMETEFAKHEAVTEVMYERALVHRTKAGKYNPLENDKNRWENITAKQICNKALELYPKAYGASKCKSLINQIEQKNLSASTYDVCIPNKPSQMNVVSTNMDKGYVRIIQTGWDFTYDDDYSEQEKFVKKLLTYKPIKEWEIELKDEKDHQPHTMEIKVPELAAGSYYVLISADKTFPLKNNAIAYTRVDVSDLTYMTRQNENHEYDVFVMSRTNGQAVANAKVQMLYSEYDYGSRRYKKSKGATFTTNADGHVKIPATTKDYRYFYLELTTANDRYNDDRSYYQYKHYAKTPYTSTRTHYFLDRKIYRPGQTIYFKGIRIQSTDDKHELQTNESVTVTLYDVNYQKVSDVTLTTNEYGSFSGSFVAPMGLINGQMHLGDSYGNIYFSVEEYKRPKFEVQFKPVEGTYRIGDKITAKGNAKSYSGVNVDGAQVKYRIMRYTNFWRWYWWWGSRPNSGDIEVTNGEVKTDENGNFEIKFDAIPDAAISNKYQPYYSYTVYADVTDINGETHSSSQSIYASNVGFSINMGIYDYVERNETEWIPLNTRNLNGTDVDAQGTVTVYKLKSPDRVLQDRKLSEPDRHQLSETDFRTTFPFEVYKHENEIDRFERGEKVFSVGFDTKKRDSIQIPGLGKWGQGAYVIEAISKDQWGNEIKEIKNFTLFSTESDKLPYPMPFFIRDLKTNCEPGDTARFLFGTGFENARILYEVDGKKGIIKKEWITVSNKQQLIEIPITEEHRGNISVHMNFVYNNRPYTYNSTIYVPFTNKQLDITFETFRNKLYPGEKEQWKVNIKGKKGEKVAAELMMAMYDASLDAFTSNWWSLSIYNSYYGYRNWENYAGYGTSGTTLYQNEWNNYYGYPSRYFYSLNWFGFYPGYYSYYYGSRYDYNDGDYEMDEMSVSETKNVRGNRNKDYAKKSIATGGALRDEGQNAPSAVSLDGYATRTVSDKLEKEKSGESTEDIAGKDREANLIPGADLGNIQARKNLAETAFFYPQLETDENGNVSVTFTMPEALTKWKVMGLAHTKDISSGTVTKEIVTQKDLMVVPNMPRFLRQGDEMTLVTKISNISENDISGDAQLFLFDALSNKPIDDRMDNKNAAKGFTVKKSQSTSVSWTIKVPDDVEAVTYKVVARSGRFTDGEEAALPVLSNRMLVIESMPLHIRKTGEKTFLLKKLMESGSSTTLKNHRLTLEFTDNPAWYAVQALPYIMEYPYECAEQTFARFYANSIATHVVNSSPKIKTVFDTWKNSSPESFLSNLHKNQELKSVMLEETPWVMEANSESERKKRIGLLFDFNRMSYELDAALRKLQKTQASNGGWPWFPGMPESRYITQHIVTGMGHLDKLGVKNIREESRTWNMVKSAVRYLDRRIEEDYEWIKKHYKDYKKEMYISSDHVQYLYARSYFKDVSMDKGCTEAVNYFKEQAQKFWLKFNIYCEGMIALALNRMDDKKTPADIVKSLKERSLFSDEMGRWWKDNNGGWYWYECHVETQALLIECFDEVANDLEMVDELKVWLLKHKQTNAWHTTKATTEACYALLMRGTEWLSDDHQVEITVGNKKIDTKAEGVKREAGTGYFKMAWSGTEIKPEMGEIKLKTSKDRVSWGALHWQYFEDLDKITTHVTNLNIVKQLFIVQDNPSGKVIKPLNEKNKLKIGDKIRVRIELRTDRDMEYVHMKDMRAAGFEPMNVFSRYKYQDGLGYYESTRDAATHFFFDRIRKGTYVFEYDLRVTHSGSFSNGITQIQCMYAPEFNSHSEGLRVEVDKKDK